MIRHAFRRLSTVFAVAIGLAIAGPAKADIVIDTFTDAASINYQIAQVNTSPFTAPPTLLGNGLTRNLSVTVASPAVPRYRSARASRDRGSAM